MSHSQFPSSPRLWLIGALLPLLAGAAPAATLVSVTDASAVTGTVLNSNVIAVSWTLPSASSNVAITANLRRQTVNNTLSAYLTTSVGPGANIVASNTLTLANGSNADIALFSGLTLASGTYYLVLQGTQVVWSFTSSPTTTLAPGVTNNPELFANGANGTPDFVTPPNSVLVPTATFTSDLHLFSVSDTQSVPEPAATALAGLAALALFRLRRSR